MLVTSEWLLYWHVDLQISEHKCCLLEGIFFTNHFFVIFIIMNYDVLNFIQLLILTEVCSRLSGIDS